jgi:hypothetical protein
MGSHEEYVPFGNFSDRGLVDAAQFAASVGSTKALEQVADVAFSRGDEELRTVGAECLQVAQVIRGKRLRKAGQIDG